MVTLSQYEWRLFSVRLIINWERGICWCIRFVFCYIDFTADNLYPVGIADVRSLTENHWVAAIETGTCINGTEGGGNEEFYFTFYSDTLVFFGKILTWKSIGEYNHFLVYDIDSNVITFFDKLDTIINAHLNVDRSIHLTNDISASIYPNPAIDLITIKSNRPCLQVIDIISINGKLLYSREIEGPVIHIDLSSFQAGVYFITVRSNDYVRTDKIVKL